LIRKSAGVSMHNACAIYQISALFEDHVIEAGAVVAKEHRA
jgi:hypothetical protein